MQDIKSRPKKSIRDIPIPEKRMRKKIKKDDPVWRSDASYETPLVPRNGKTPRWRIWAVAGVALVIVVFAISVIFEHATVRIIPKSETVSINTNVEFIRGGGSSDSGVPYDLIELSAEKRKDVAGGSAVATSSKARGMITIYNNYSDDSFELIDQTRFESPDGHIYRIQERIRVPGRTDNGTEVYPGSIEAEVVAEDVGSEYNVYEATFTIPGLEGTEAFDNMYAEIHSPISGGAKDSEVVVSQQEKEQAEVELKNEITEELLSRVESETPEGFLFIQDVSPIDFTVSVEQGTDVAVIRVVGEIKAVIANEEHLANKLLAAAGKIADEDTLEVPYSDQVQFTYNGEGDFDPRIGERFTLRLSGQTTLVWSIDENAIAEELTGVSKKDFESIMKDHNEVLSADLVIRPIWKLRFPKKSGDIKVVNTFYEDAQ